MTLRSFVEAAEDRIDALHALVVVHRGETVAEVAWHPYALADPHRLFSLSKTVTGTATAFAVAEGLVALDDPVTSYFPVARSRLLIRHLLTMSTGHELDTVGPMTATEDWVGAFLAMEPDREPGTIFTYNSGASYVLGAVVQEAAGARLLDFLRPRLFEPLGITDATWEQCPAGRDVGGWGLTLRAKEIASLGELYRDDAHGLLPPGWRQEATRAHADTTRTHTDPDWREGYGYHLWCCRHGAFRADGAFGQFCVVVPSHALTVAITAGTEDLQGVLDLIWSELLPGLGDPLVETRSLPALTGVDGAHAGRYEVTQPRRTRVDDWRPSHEQPPTIRAITVEPGLVVIEDDTGTHRHPFAPGIWTRTGPTAATAAWSTPDEFQLKVAYTDGPFTRAYACSFTPDDVTIRPSDNVSFGPTGYPSVTAAR